MKDLIIAVILWTELLHLHTYIYDSTVADHHYTSQLDLLIHTIF